MSCASASAGALTCRFARRVSICPSVASAAWTAASAGQDRRRAARNLAGVDLPPDLVEGSLVPVERRLRLIESRLGRVAAVEQRALPIEFGPREVELRLRPLLLRLQNGDLLRPLQGRLAGRRPAPVPAAASPPPRCFCARCIEASSAKSNCPELHLIAGLDRQLLDSPALLRRHEDEVAFDIALVAEPRRVPAQAVPGAAASGTRASTAKIAVRRRFMTASLRKPRIRSDRWASNIASTSRGSNRSKRWLQIRATTPGRRRAAETARARPSEARHGRAPFSATARSSAQPARQHFPVVEFGDFGKPARLGDQEQAHDLRAAGAEHLGPHEGEKRPKQRLDREVEREHPRFEGLDRRRRCPSGRVSSKSSCFEET